MILVLADVAESFKNAIDFLLHERESVTGGTRIGGAELIGLTLNHIALSAAALGLAALVAVPLGTYLGHHRQGQFAAINASNVGRAVPTLVLLAVFISWLGVGFIPIMLALFLLGLPPILTNTWVGVRQVEPDAVDAAAGMGMSDVQIMRRVELPLAVATIFAGVRVAAVNVVATATIAPLGSVDSLGTPIISENVYGEDGQLGAAIAVSVLTLIVSLGLGALQKAATPRGVKLGEQASQRRGLLRLRRRETAAT